MEGNCPSLYIYILSQEPNRDPIIWTHWNTTRGKWSQVKKVVNFDNLGDIFGKSGLPMANPATHDDCHMRSEIKHAPETGSNRLQIEHRPHQVEAFDRGMRLRAPENPLNTQATEHRRFHIATKHNPHTSPSEMLTKPFLGPLFPSCGYSV